MLHIFTETTTLLASEFVSSFPAEKLAFALFRISKDAGVEFNQVKKTFSVVGDWNKVIEAHSHLQKYLEREKIASESDQNDFSISTSVKNGAVLEGKRGRKPGCTVSTFQQEIIPKPYVHYANPVVENKSDEDILAHHNDKELTKLVRKDSVEEWAKQSSSEALDTEQSCIDPPGYSEKVIQIKEEFDEAAMNDDTDVDEQYVDCDTSEHVQSPHANEISNKFNIKDESIPDDVQINVKKSRRKSKPRKLSETDGQADNTSGTISLPIKKKGKSKGKIKDNPDKRVKDLQNVRVKKTKPLENVKVAEEYKCDRCDYTGRKRENLREHTQRMHRNMFTCEVCSKQFGLHKDLLRHTRHVHTNPSYHCKLCNKTYKFSRAYKEHMLKHQEDYVKPLFECEICHKTFSTKYVLTAHVKSEHLGMKKSFVCPTCGRSFTQKNSYLMHANVHAGIKPYVCDVCGKAFSYDKSLKEHKYMHDDERRFVCKTCGKTFRQKTSLLMHVKVHKDARDYICSTCGKGFTQKQALLRHERIHSGDKPFKCALCLRAFNDYSIIRRHMMMHHKRDKDPRTWRGDVICTLKRKTEFYISGGPGYNGGETVPTVSDIDFNSSPKDQKEALTSTEQSDGQEEKDKPNDSHVENVEENVQYPNNSEISSSYQSMSKTESVAGKGVQQDNRVSPLNYSIPGAYPQAVPVPSSESQDISRQYQDMVDYHEGQRRELYMQNLSSLTPVPVLHGPHLATATGDVSQSQSLSSHWSFPMYPPYCSPANFSQFQGPQS